jgi:hypothetical protein
MSPVLDLEPRSIVPAGLGAIALAACATLHLVHLRTAQPPSTKEVSR